MGARSVVLAAVLAVLLPVAPVDGSEHPVPDCEVRKLQASGPTPVAKLPCEGVRPGSRVTIPVSSYCSVNFLFRGSDDRVYAGTAGHCVFKDDDERAWAPGTGPPASLVSDGTRIGEYAYAVDRRFRDDFALIRLDPGVPYDPAMCHFGGPTGIYDDLDPEPVGVHHVGNGFLVSEVVNARSGIALHTLDPHYLAFHGTATWGDSGSGLIASDGRAIGVIVHLRFDPFGTTGAVRLGPQLALAEAALGIELEILTAPFERGALP